jgi:hypothetical protein
LDTMGMLQLAHSFLYDDQNACKEQADVPHSIMEDMASGYFDLPGAKR